MSYLFNSERTVFIV